ncbi:MAG: hypothetical protein UHD09_03910, partial [Bifidobacterium sp.]|nr:hypothetical protein [Bifidobacterium sp.]
MSDPQPQERPTQRIDVSGLRAGDDVPPTQAIPVRQDPSTRTFPAQPPATASAPPHYAMPPASAGGGATP